MRELLSIVNYGRINPAIDIAVFPATPPYYLWSSSSYYDWPSHAWIVSFNLGNGYNYGTLNVKTESFNRNVRCVRGGP